MENLHVEELEYDNFPCDGCPFEDPSQRDCMENCPCNINAMDNLIALQTI